jgi:probable selenium-dependent hydroxylase accessory protein YqeC
MGKDLASTLGLGRREHVAIVGGGGKTSLMHSLAEELCQGGFRVVASTTTKVWRWQAGLFTQVIFSGSDSAWQEKLKKAIEKDRIAFVGHALLESDKVEGLSISQAESVFKDPWVDYLILEADGSAGRPIKAPAAHEPVIPPSATLVVAMMGLESIGKRLDADVVFRPDRYEKVTGYRQGATLTLEAIAKIFRAREGLFKGAPISARRVAFLNKLDLLPDDRAARELATLLLQGQTSPVNRVVVGSITEKSYLTFD